MDHFLTFVVLLSFTSSFFSVLQSTEFTIVNECQSTIWPAVVGAEAAGTPITPTGFILEINASKILKVPNSWNGRVWGRTDCSTNTSSEYFSCVTGDCDSGDIECSNSGIVSPTTLAEFSLRQTQNLDFYDVSLVFGFNLPILVVPIGIKSRGCFSTSCVANINTECPLELKRMNSKKKIVGCDSACATFRTEEFCCTGNNTKCQPTAYSSFFKKRCPNAYSTFLDDEIGTFNCASGADYSIIFCPTNTSLIPGPALAPSPTPERAASAPGPNAPPAPNHARNWIRIFLGVVVAVLLIISFLGLFWCQRRNCYLQVIRRISGLQGREHTVDTDSRFFSYRTLEIATNYFSDESLLGRGGYGPVYKGKLLNGQEIAVKRLQRLSCHGIEQFKNEVAVILNLQHRNLVSLLGYCIEKDDRILVYEFLPNKSLDSILFDTEKRTILGWKSRLQIIEGIAQGLLYLHKYSRLKIIHRDLKASNILLDKDLNPKISDFGTAKIFGDDELRANTNRIVGTYGYMAPEYAMDGIFSMKSDVFSFGVMMLEIISGKKNTGFYNSDRHINLLGYVWDLWNEERFLEIKDPNLAEKNSVREVVRYVQVGLLCVQENATDRPNMSDVVSMLLNETMSLPAPKQPSFTAISSVTNAELCKTLLPTSVNMVTISDVSGR